MRTTLSLAGALMLAAAAGPVLAAPAADEVLETYADMALAMYEDSLATARELDAAIDALVSAPSAEALAAARSAWLAARVPYQQTEGYRFGNPVVDAWEGKVNAWPLDEGMIDYVAAAYGESSDENPLYTLNVIAQERLRIGPEEIDASTITPGLIGQIHEAMDVEKNVATGYHAIEFLLWGQDLNGTRPGAGERPWTDYAGGDACTHGDCERRAAYLAAASDLLLEDLAEIVAAWGEGGAAREELLQKEGRDGLAVILTGLGSLSYGELAGERMKLGLLLHDPEEEHDCFSDNTHNSHYYNQVGMMAIWNGRYVRTDGSIVAGPSVAEIAAAEAPEAKAELDRLMGEAEARLRAVKETADSGTMAYDQMLGEENAEGKALLQAAIDALVAQAKGVEAVVAGLGATIEIEGSDSLDDPDAVAE